MNYLSKPYSVDQPVEMGGNTQLAMSVLTNLQSRYDSNKAAIDTTLAQYESLRGLTDEDNAYLAAQISSIKNQTNQLGSLNLAHSSGRDSILSSLRNVMKDPIVQDILVSKANYDSYNAEVSKMKEKNPEKYNNANYQYGLSQGGYYDYVQGKSKKLDSMTYIPYKDLTEENLKALKTIKDLKGKRFVETPDPNNPGQIIRKEIDGLTNQEIQEYFGGTMTSEQLQQMQINGWAKYATNEPQAREYFADYNTKVQAVYGEQLKLAQDKSKNTALSQSQRDDAEREIKSLETKISQAKVKVENKNKYNIKDISLDLEKSSYLSNLSNIASTEWSYSTEKDDVYFAKEQLKLDYEDLAIKKAKEEREQMEFPLKMKKEYGLNVDGTPAIDEQVSITSREGVLPDNVSGIQSLQQASDAQFKIVTDTTKDLISKLKPDERAHFLAELKKRGVDATLNKVGTGRVVITDAIQESFDAANLGNYKNYADIINTASLKKEAIAKDVISVEGDSYFSKFKENPNKYIEAFKDAYNSVKSGLQTSTTTERYNTLLDTKKRVEDFVIKNGGWDKLEKELLTNPVKVREFAKVKLSGATGGGARLEEDAKEVVETTLKDYSKSGRTTSFSVYDNINFLDPNTRERIINRIPQDRLEEGGVNFNAKGALTARKVGDKIELIQFKGKDKDGNPVYAKASYDKGDFGLYDEVAKYVDFEENKRMDINVNENVNFKKRSTRFDVNDDDISKEKKYGNAVQVSLNNNPNIKDSFAKSIGDPVLFSTPQAIKHNFKEALKYSLPNDVPDERINAFVDTYVANINTFSLKITQKDDPTSVNPGDKVFGYDIYNGNNKSIGGDALGIKNLDKDTKYLLEYQPQVYITDFIYRAIKRDPTYIDRIFKK